MPNGGQIRDEKVRIKAVLAAREREAVQCGQCGKVPVKEVLGRGLDICDGCFFNWMLEGFAKVVEVDSEA